MKAELMNRDEEVPTIAVQELLGHVLTMDASDLHVTVGAKPALRIHSDLKPLEQYDVLGRPGPSDGLRHPHPAPTRKVGAGPRAGHVVLAARPGPVPGQRLLPARRPGRRLRFIPFVIRTTEELGLPPQVADFARLPRGLVLVTGPTGSGKSTTLAALIDVVTQRAKVHIAAMEDPIEYLHRHKSGPS